MEIHKKKALKERYMDLLKTLGYKIIYDLDKEMEDGIHDLKLLMTMRFPDPELYDPAVALRYIPFVIESASDLGFRVFEMFSQPRQDMGEFIVRINNKCLMNYSVDDMAAILLKNGVHLDDMHQFKDGKGRFVLTPEGIRLIVDTLSTQGSPLENFAVRKKILGLK